MTAITETLHAGGFMISEANGTYSRDAGTLRIGNDLAAGTVLMDSGSTDSLGRKIVTAWTDGDAIGVLWDAADATSVAQSVAYVARAAEVRFADLTYASQTAVTAADVKDALKAIGIVCR